MPRHTSRELFLESVVKEVADCGLENLRTKKIAQRAGYSEAMMFRYFNSKDEMLRQAFLVVDARVSALLTNGDYLDRLNASNEADDFEAIAREAWEKIFHYLLDTPYDTLYLLRFRYCALYDEEIRSQRKAYQGAFDKYYEAISKKLGVPVQSNPGFILNYTFELTLCLAEKIVSGRITNSAEVEDRLWATIKAAILTITSK